MTMRVNYYANGDWVGGHHWSGPRAINHALEAFRCGKFTQPFVYRFQSSERHGVGCNIQMTDKHNGIHYGVVIEPA